MSTLLHILTNAPHQPESITQYNRILDGLKKMNIKKASHWNSTGDKMIKGHLNWSYRIINPDKFNEDYQVEFEGDFMNYPRATGLNWRIDSCYTYNLIYKNFELDWFMDFRMEIFKMVQLLGGSEIIYVADSAYHELSEYLAMAEEGTSYNKIRKKLQNDLGDPITDYTKLEYETLDYQNITEYFLDDFRDLKKR